jgi:hypothetical protein
MSSSSRCASPEAITRRSAAVALGAAACVLRARAQTGTPQPPDEVRADLPGARLQGQGRLRYFGLHVYDIRLWVPAPLRAEDATRVDAALEIEYARRLVGTLIAERSLAEMQRLAAIGAVDAERWLATMKQLFPDVRAGDRITGVHRAGERARFHFNGSLLGEVRDATFARLFFGIWLSPHTSEPQLRAALLGRSA